uniref:non-specific serine/threonine protein kinase n=1 Tax=Kalanchoe fedtschenkoi TaxID=63787 RepID=A0A7N0TWE5_KALFE
MARNVAIFIKVVICAVAMASPIHAQVSTDFISIDCGSSTSYTESTTYINYVPDAGYIDSGVSKSIATQYKTSGLGRQFENVRSFPDGDRNCYTLKPHQVKGTQYLIRARFMYGNYDSLNKFPEFDLYVGGNLWTTVNISDSPSTATAEIIHAPSSPITYVCLVNKGKGIPFISVLELRLMKNTIYNSTSGSMTLLDRLDLGSSYEYRYTYDVYDRIWTIVDWSATMKSISTSRTVINTESNYAQPSAVMQTALTPIDPYGALGFSWKSDLTTQYYLYLHFAEIQTLGTYDLRQFNIYLNGAIYGVNLTPRFLSATTMYTSTPITPTATLYNFTFVKTSLSTLPPILNAIELYSLTNMSQMETNSDDVEAVQSIKSTYNLNRIWQGDPCAPRNYIWKGLNCSFTINQAPRILALNLSSSKLGGKISAYIYDLKLLQSLDLSNNNFVGTVPDFLSHMTSLKYINLSGNNLNGIVPADLLAKSKQGSLTLSVEGIPYLCLTSPCDHTLPGRKTNLLIPIIASVVGVIVLLLVVLVVALCRTKKKKPQGVMNNNNVHPSNSPVVVVTDEMPRSQASIEEPVKGSIMQQTQNERIHIKNHRFTSSEISNMTNNFSRVIGKGGFGTVYLGRTDDGDQVAVKILSASSTQGYKEFKAEAQLLMTVHHRNLTSLIGYCDEDETLGLVYEFMANGNLGSHISDKNLEYLTWEDRLHIALDAAQGLEYLHIGCKEPIVHRDIKPTNILLNEKFEAKLADFGLSRAFRTDNGQTSFVPTIVAGTPGYLDPEYYHTQQLNEKSDVFSFGIVLLEIITSRPVMSDTPERIHVSIWASHVLSNQGDIKLIIDKRLQGDYDTNSAWKVIEVAMACVSTTSHRRPTMTQVVSDLSQCLSMEKARKNEGLTSGTIDSVEMLPFGVNNEFGPSAR